MTAALDIRDLVKSYGGHPVLRRVSFALAPGEILGLLGENGAGKSTLFKCVAGMTRRDSGKIIFNGRALPAHFDERAARDAGIGMIPQESTLVPSLSAAANIFLGREITSHGWLKTGEMNAKARELFTRLGADIDPETECGELSPGARQFVEIARALAWDSRLLILDEPTTMLAPAEVERLFAAVRQASAQGACVMIVSHKLEEVRSLCTSAAILRDGELVYRGPASISAAEMASRMVGRDLANVYPPREKAPGEVLFAAQKLAAGPLHDLSFEVKTGEILGVAGLMGSGRSFLAETLFGLHKLQSGSMTLAGASYRPGGPSEAMRRGVSLLPEDRQKTGLFTEFSIADNMAMNRLREFGKWLLSRRKIAENARRGAKLFSIRMTSPDDPARTLSGGNQQKVAFAKSCASHPLLFLFDEPTRGVDIGARGEIYKLIRGMAARGTGCILVSSDLEELLGMSDRVLVLRGGRQAGILDRENLSEQAVATLAFGVKQS